MKGVNLVNYPTRATRAIVIAREHEPPLWEALVLGDYIVHILDACREQDAAPGDSRF